MLKSSLAFSVLPAKKTAQDSFSSGQYSSILRRLFCDSYQETPRKRSDKRKAKFLSLMLCVVPDFEDEKPLRKISV